MKTQKNKKPKKTKNPKKTKTQKPKKTKKKSCSSTADPSRNSFFWSFFVAPKFEFNFFFGRGPNIQKKRN
jgi:hypothetical protein